MSSSGSGTGSNISAQDAIDLLHKLITESTKVQAVFVGRGSVSSGVIGLVRIDPDGLVWVKEGTRVDEAFIRFDPTAATSFKYGDNRAFPPVTVANAPRLSSAVCFIYPDGSQVLLFEIAPA
jgi:hypothetical protein